MERMCLYFSKNSTRDPEGHPGVELNAFISEWELKPGGGTC